MTPAILCLEQAGIPYTLHRYRHDPRAESFGLEAATLLGVDPARMFKTLILQVEGKGLVQALVPVADKVDVKKVASVCQAKNAALADAVKAERATGYVVGGISPIGGKRKLPTLVDQSIIDQQTILVSAGQRGLQLELSPMDLIQLTEAMVAHLRAVNA